MSETLIFTGELTIVMCWCGTKHAVPSGMREFQLREADAGRRFSIFCPHGHEYFPGGESRATKLERQLAQERQRLDQAQAEICHQRKLVHSAERSASALRGVVTRTKRRVSRGVCPCCCRHFENLERHMRGQHPEYAQGDDCNG